jgi:hypothetical protein
LIKWIWQYFSARIFLSKVAAELYAQEDDQEFVNLVCYSSQNLSTLRMLRKESFEKGSKTWPFNAVCILLADTMESESFDIELRRQCMVLLIHRVGRFRENGRDSILVQEMSSRIAKCNHLVDLPPPPI